MMNDSEQSSLPLPKLLVLFLALANVLGLVTLVDIALPKDGKTVRVIELYDNLSFDDGDGGSYQYLSTSVFTSSGHEYRVDRTLADPLREGDEVQLLTTKIFGKPAMLKTNQGFIIQRQWGLFTGLMWVPMVLVISTLVAILYRKAAVRAVIWLAFSFFACIGTLMLIFYPS